MQQINFSNLAYTHKKKTTRKERFLAEMNDLLPWSTRSNPLYENFPNRGRVAGRFHPR